MPDGLGGPLYDLFARLTTVMHCAIDAKDENKKIGTVLNLFHK
jgi:hypothetical protein